MAVLIKGVLGELINNGGGGGGGGKLKSGGLVSGQKTAFQNFVKQDSLKSVQSSLLGD